MNWRTVEKITLFTRLFGVLLFIYTTLCFGVLEQYNLRGIGNHSAYLLYWRCLVISCLVFVFDFVAQIFKLLSNSSWPRYCQAFLYLSSFVLVVLISTNYPNLICDGDRYDLVGYWTIEDQIKSVRVSVIYDSLYIGIRSLAYSVILLLEVSKRKPKLDDNVQ